MAETSNSVGSIPDSGISGKELVERALAGEPVYVHECSLEVKNTASVVDMLHIGKALFNTSTTTSVVLYFCLGDLHQHTAAYSKGRRDLELGIEQALGSSYALRLKEFGRIAKRWPAKYRTTERCWQYYKDYKPGEYGKPDSVVAKKVIPLKFVSRVTEADEEIVTLENGLKQQYEYRRSLKVADPDEDTDSFADEEGEDQ